MSASEAVNGNPARYFATLPTLVDGAGSALMVDSRGRLILAAELTANVGGTYNATPPTLSDGGETALQMDVNGNLKVVEQYVPVYEDNTNGKAVVEHRYTPSYKLTSDTLVKTGAGLLHSIIITCNDAAPTAGSIIIYDNTAESGSELFNHTFTTTPFPPATLPNYDAIVTNGIYVGFTTTTDVNVFLTYR